MRGSDCPGPSSAEDSQGFGAVARDHQQLGLPVRLDPIEKSSDVGRVAQVRIGLEDHAAERHEPGDE